MANIRSIGGNPIVLGMDGLEDEVKSGLASSGGYSDLLTAGAADGIKGGGHTVDAAFLHRVTGGGQASDGPATIEVIRGNTIVQDGELVSVQMEGVESVGFNLLPSAPIFFSGSQPFNKSKCVRLSAGHEYYYRFDSIEGATSWRIGMQLYDMNGAHVDAPANSPDYGGAVTPTFGMQGFYYNIATQYFAQGSNQTARRIRFIANIDCYARFYFSHGDTGASNVMNGARCNLSGPRNGEYEPYWSQTRSIPATDMRSAGSVYDELRKGERITRVGQTTIDGSGVGHWVYSVQAADDVLRCRVFPSGLATISGNGTNLTATRFTSEFDINKPYSCYQSIDALWFILPQSAVTDLTVAAANAWFAANPTEVTFLLATPTTTTIDPPLNLTYRAEQGGTETVLVPDGEMSAPVPMVVVYGSTPDGILDRSASLLAAADGPTATANHAIGSYLTMGGQLYKVTTAIASGEAITPGTNVMATTVMAEVLSLIQ